MFATTKDFMKKIYTVGVVCLISAFLSGCKKSSAESKFIEMFRNNTESRVLDESISEAESNCQKLTQCECAIKKDTDGKLTVNIGVPLGNEEYPYCEAKTFKESDNDIAELWSGVFGTGLTANWGGPLNNTIYMWPLTHPYGIEKKGVDSTLIKKVEVLVYEQRRTKEKIDNYGKIVIPIKVEKKIKYKITVVPGNAAKFEWYGGHISDVWNNVKKEAKVARSIVAMDTGWVSE